MKLNNTKLNKSNLLSRALATWHPKMQGILVRSFQRKLLTKENYLEETLGFL